MKYNFFLPKMLLIALCIGILGNCKNEIIEDDTLPDPVDEIPVGTRVLPAYEQRSGDPDEGYDYLVNGDYISSGIPYDIFLTAFGRDESNKLGRSGDNAVINHEYTAVDAPNGVRVVAPNCLQCHASEINGEFIVGLGNTQANFMDDQSDVLPIANAAIQFIYGSNSPEWEAYEPFAKAVEATGPLLIVENRGPNPADKIAAVLAAHRDRNSLVWQETPAVEIPEEVVPTDVPPWWILKKKNAMFYAAIGRGDFSRIMMSSSLLTMIDSTKAREVDHHFGDVLAYINSLEAPDYPFEIDQTLVAEGELVFKNNCAKCHGTYGDEETYPNLLVDIDVIQTDRTLSDIYQSEQFTYFRNWINEGWFGQNPYAAELVAEGGYVAPPLDGIWATAPYLHNGSVPTIADLLKSSDRPAYWRRSFDNSDYDPLKLGWNYTTENEKIDDDTYDTTIPGYRNTGHSFGDVLTDGERKALMEYLKTI